MTRKEKLREAIRCCVRGECQLCPMLEETCDDLRVDMVDLPEELVEKICEELERSE